MTVTRKTIAAVCLGVLLGIVATLPTPAATTSVPAAALHSERVAYALIGGQPVYGYLSRPAAVRGPQPGLILIPMWWGLNRHMRELADGLARQGYTVLAVDLYNGRTTRDPQVAAQLMDAANGNAAVTLSNLEQAVSYLNGEQHVTQLGVIGWSVGGQWAFRIASDLPQAFDALAVFYAVPYTEPSQLAPLRMPMLAFFGGRDPFVPPAVVQRFQWAAGLASVRLDIHIYPDARAGFDDPDSTAYNAAAAEDAWKQLEMFLADQLKRGSPSG